MVTVSQWRDMWQKFKGLNYTDQRSRTTTSDSRDRWINQRRTNWSEKARTKTRIPSADKILSWIRNRTSYEKFVHVHSLSGKCRRIICRVARVSLSLYWFSFSWIRFKIFLPVIPRYTYIDQNSSFENRKYFLAAVGNYRWQVQSKVAVFDSWKFQERASELDSPSRREFLFYFHFPRRYRSDSKGC